MQLGNVYTGVSQSIPTTTTIKRPTKTKRQRLLDEIQNIDISQNIYDNDSDERKFCSSHNEWSYINNKTERSILPDLRSYTLPEDIKLRADAIYNKMKYQVRRGKIRSQMLFFCVYCAYLELANVGEVTVDPVQLGKLFNLTPGEVQRCDSLFSPLQTGYKPPSVYTSPLGYLPDYCEAFGLSEDTIPEIIKLSTSILQKDKSLFEENPQTVAAGLLRYYTVTNGIISDDPQKIINITGRSVATIDTMYRRLSTIDNK